MSINKFQQLEEFIREFAGEIVGMSPDDVDFILSYKLGITIVGARIHRLQFAVQQMKIRKDKQFLAFLLRLHPADLLFL
jgi:hypothetical protein